MDVDTFYNTLDLHSPSILQFRLCCDDPEKASQKMKTIFSKALCKLQDQESLHLESCILSRIIYKWKLRLRHDKGFKALQKVNRSLLQYLALNLVSLFENTKEMLNVECGPSRQTIELVLVRLQGFSKLFDNIYHRCIEVASYMNWRFESGHFWDFALISTAVVSRIWTISIDMIKECSIWYSELKTMLPICQPALQQWLPKNYEFPESIAAWLDYPDYLGIQKTINKTESDSIQKQHLGKIANKSGKMKENCFNFKDSLKKKNQNKEFEHLVCHTDGDDNKAAVSCIKLGPTTNGIKEMNRDVSRISSIKANKNNKKKSVNTVKNGTSLNDAHAMSMDYKKNKKKVRVDDLENKKSVNSVENVTSLNDVPVSMDCKKKTKKKVRLASLDDYPDKIQPNIKLKKCVKNESTINKAHNINCKKNNKKKITCDDSLAAALNRITSRLDLVKFITKEKRLRKRQNETETKCLTRNFDKLQWQMFRKFVDRKLQEIVTNPGNKKLLENVKNEIKLWFA